MAWLTLAEMGEPVRWVVLGLAVLIIGIAKSGFGGGVGIVAVPMFALAFADAQEAMGVMLPILILADALSVVHHWGRWDRVNLAQLLPGSLVGIVAGTWVLYQFGKLEQGASWMKIAIGGICVVYVALDQLRERVAPQWHWRPGWIKATGTGLGSGVVSTLAHAAGPVVAIYLLGQRMAKGPFLGTAVIYFFLVNTIKLIPYGALGMIDGASLWRGLWLAPLAPVGTWLGVRLHRRLSERLFRNVILVIVFVTGVQMIVQEVSR